MDVIDEGKSNRHVAVTSESLSHSLINQAHDIKSAVNTWILHHKMETKLKTKKPDSGIFLGIHLEKFSSVVSFHPC